MSAYSWSNPYIRGVKRDLSTYEKASLLVTSGRALIFPGEPPDKETESGEVEELISCGFDPHYIYAIENNLDASNDLYEHYFDLIPIHFIEVSEFLTRSKSKFSYIHLDFCTQLHQDELDAIQSWVGKLDEISRARVSVLTSRRMPAQIEYEQMLRRLILLRLCEECEKLDTLKPSRWHDYWSCLFDSTDTTQIIVGVMLLNFFFGIDSWAYSDRCLSKPYLPGVAGGQCLEKITRFTYSEIGNPHTMATVWVDLEPIEYELTEQETVNYVAEIFSVICEPIPDFIPEFFAEK